MTYVMHLAVFGSVYLVLALSLNLVVGYSGLLTLAHGAYFAVGAYAFGIASLAGGMGFIPAAAVAVLVSAALSFVVSLPAWRYRGEMFVLVSLAAQMMLFSVIYNWWSPSSEPGTLANLTNGPFGLRDVPSPRILGVSFDTVGATLALYLGVALVVVVVSSRLSRSPWARVLRAVRDDELATRNLGKPVYRLKLEVFAISCGMAGLAGAMYASYMGYIHPSIGNLDASILFLAMVVVGGSGNMRGPLVGVVVLLLLPEALRFVRLPESMAADIRMMAYGLLLIVLVRFRPQGLAGVYRVE